MISWLRSVARFIDWLPGRGTPWTPAARRAYFARDDLISSVLSLRSGMEETMRLARADDLGGSGLLSPTTVSAADRAETIARTLGDADVLDLFTGWRTALDRLPAVRWTQEDSAAALVELAAKMARVNQRLAALMDEQPDSDRETVETHDVQRVRIDDDELVLEQARIEINRTRHGESWWSWRLDGLAAAPLPSTIRSGRLCELWAPIGSLGAFTGRGVVTIGELGGPSGEAATLHVDGLEFRVV